MGTITKIRQISPYIFIVFAVLFIVFMVLSDNVSQIAGGGENMQTAVICEINGDEIYYKDFEERLRIRLEQMRSDPQNAGQDIQEQTIRTQVWEELVREKLLQQVGNKFGISVSNDEILDILIENPPDYLKSSFTDSTGAFNKALYLEIITRPETVVNYIGQDPAQIPQEMKEQHIADWRNRIIAVTDYLKLQRLNEAVANTLASAYSVSSPTYVTRKYIDDNSSADINYINVPVFAFPDTAVKVTEEEMRAYYDKNKENFKVKNERKAKYLTFVVQPSTDDSAKNSKRIELLQSELAKFTSIAEKDSVFSIKLNEYSGTENDWALLQDMNPQTVTLFANAQEREIVGPVILPDGLHFYRLDGRRTGTNEVVKASHILIASGNNKDSAKTVAQDLRKQVNTSNFADLARERSDDKGSGAQGGDLGYFSKGRMVPEFEQAAFNSSVGSIVGPIESQFGYHIIYVVDKRSEELKYSDITFKVETSSATKKQLLRNAHAAMQQLVDGTNIDTLATKLKVNCETTQFVANNQSVLGSMYLTSKLFESKLNDVLEPREVFNGNQIVVMQLAEIRKEGIGSYEDDTLQIRQKLIKAKKLDLAQKRAEEVYNLIKSNATLEGISELPYSLKVNTASIKNNGSIPGASMDVPATTKAFELPTGKINEPVRTEMGYFIFEVKNKIIPSEDAAKDATDLMRAQYARTLFDTWFAKFKEESDIKDYRSKYYTDF